MRRGWVVTAVASTAVAAMMLALGACTGDTPPGVPTAGGAPASPSGASANVEAKELQFVACMRQQGVTDMPDPIPGDTSGRSAVRYALDVMGKGSDAAFQAALDKCVSFLPAPEPTRPASAPDMEKYIQFAKCVRDHGVPDFPDPMSGPDGRPLFTFVQPNPSGTGKALVAVGDGRSDEFRSDPALAAAAKACQSMLPAPSPATSE